MINENCAKFGSGLYTPMSVLAYSYGWTYNSLGVLVNSPGKGDTPILDMCVMLKLIGPIRVGSGGGGEGGGFAAASACVQGGVSALG